jgi:hypothetical protein
LLGKRLRRSMNEFYPRTEHFIRSIVHFLGTSSAQPHPTIRRHLSESDIEMSQGHGQAQAVPKVTVDSDLVRRALARDEAAVRAIMKANNRRLYRLARGILRNDAEAEDVVQETMSGHSPI